MHTVERSSFSTTGTSAPCPVAFYTSPITDHFPFPLPVLCSLSRGRFPTSIKIMSRSKSRSAS